MGRKVLVVEQKAYHQNNGKFYHLKADQAWTDLESREDAVEMLFLQFICRAGEMIRGDARTASHLLPSIMVYIGNAKKCSRRVTLEALALLCESCRRSDIFLEDISLITAATVQELDGPLSTKATELVTVLLSVPQRAEEASRLFLSAGIAPKLLHLLEKTPLAAVALRQVAIHESEAILNCGGLTAVVQCFLSSPDHEIKTQCATALRLLVHGLDDKAISQIMPHIPGVISMLEAHAQTDALHAVARLAMIDSCQSKLLAVGSIRCIVRILQSHDNSKKHTIVAAAAGALANLCHGQHQARAQQALANAEGIRILTDLLSHFVSLCTEHLQMYHTCVAALALAVANAVRRNSENQQQAVSCGVLSTLTKIVDSDAVATESKVLAPVLGALLNLVENSPASSKILRNTLNCPQVLEELAVKLQDGDAKEYLAKLLNLVVDRCRLSREQSCTNRRRSSEPSKSNASSHQSYENSRCRVASDPPPPPPSFQELSAAGGSRAMGYNPHRSTKLW